EAHAVLVLLPNTATPVILFNQAHDPKKEQWTGEVIGQEKAVQHYGVDAAYPIHQLDEKIPALLSGKKLIYFPWGDACIRENMSKWIKQAMQNSRFMPWPDLIALQKIIEPMRLIKSPEEIRLLKESARISAHAHNHAMQTIKPGMMEYQLAGEYIYQFTQQGALDIAYLPIVGGGKNACTLHYIANKDVLRDGDLVLVDAGSEYQYYCADVSRTFPVNGKFTDAQRAVYDVVLNAYLAGLEKIKPGSDWTVIRKAVDETLTAGLRDLKLPGELSEYFMHGPGHWLGLDVHDAGPYKIDDKPTIFKPNMVLTLEPGLYIKDWQMGIRIEDDILVTEQGCEVMSKDSPILPEDIEQLMK
ncbi:MAG: aminopeptidase P N-terminal domain-containing protein, partial [Gammaproteobacteria bacterium]